MANYEEIPCKCGSHFIENRTHWLCHNCNYFRLHGKTLLEAQKQKQQKQPKKIYKLKKYPVKKAKKAFKKNPGKRSEKEEEILKLDRELYFYIFTTKPHRCEECGISLPDIFVNEDNYIVTIAQYSHILTKNAFPEYRHNKLNMNRLCPIHHTQWEFGDREIMKIYKPNQLIIEKIKGIDNNNYNYRLSFDSS